MRLAQFEKLITGRTHSLFHEEITGNLSLLRSELSASRILVIGAAGSIGSALVKQLAALRPPGIVLIDLDENALVELVRDLRSSPGVALPDDFATLSIGLGSREFERYCSEAIP